MVVAIVRLLSRAYLQHHGLHHDRLPCPSPSPRACSDSCPLSWWCHPTISSSAVPFSSRPLSFPTSRSFPVSSSHQVVKVSKLQLQHQSFQWIFRVDFLEDGLVWSPWSPRNSQESSPLFFQTNFCFQGTYSRPGGNAKQRNNYIALSGGDPCWKQLLLI